MRLLISLTMRNTFDQESELPSPTRFLRMAYTYCTTIAVFFSLCCPLPTLHSELNYSTVLPIRIDGMAGEEARIFTHSWQNLQVVGKEVFDLTAHIESKPTAFLCGARKECTNILLDSNKEIFHVTHIHKHTHIHREASKTLRYIKASNIWAEKAGYQLHICSHELEHHLFLQLLIRSLVYSCSQVCQVFNSWLKFSVQNDASCCLQIFPVISENNSSG